MARRRRAGALFRTMADLEDVRCNRRRWELRVTRSWQKKCGKLPRNMNRAAKFVCSLGCLTSIVGPVLALLLYAKANWRLHYLAGRNSILIVPDGTLLKS